MDEKLKRYQGIFPAFYACYDDTGRVSTSRTKSLAKYLLAKGVTGLYVGGSSGECIYQSVEERKTILEAVMDAVGGKLVVIAHVACNNTADSCELARHAESLGVDAIAAIPPIYFHLPPYAIADYWNAISAAAPNTDFIIYNIPQLAGVALSTQLLQEMAKNPRVIGVKNSSMPTQDIQMWRDATERELVVFNGPDEQLLSGLAAGAVGGIGGTYAAMPELYERIFTLVRSGGILPARNIQDACCHIIYKMCSGQGNMYAMIKEILRLRGAPDIGGVRAPLYPLQPGDEAIAASCAADIDAAIAQFCC